MEEIYVLFQDCIYSVTNIANTEFVFEVSCIDRNNKYLISKASNVVCSVYWRIKHLYKFPEVKYLIIPYKQRKFNPLNLFRQGNNDDNDDDETEFGDELLQFFNRDDDENMNGNINEDIDQSVDQSIDQPVQLQEDINEKLDTVSSTETISDIDNLEHIEEVNNDQNENDNNYPLNTLFGNIMNSFSSNLRKTSNPAEFQLDILDDSILKITDLSKFTNLIDLDLGSAMKVSCLTSLVHLTKLKFIGNQHIKNINVNLKFLDCQNCAIDVSDLTQLETLRYLSLSQKITFDFLNDHQKLTQLFLVVNPKSDLRVNEFINLKSLMLSFKANVDQLVNLEEIAFVNSYKDLNQLLCMPKLRKLKFSDIRDFKKSDQIIINRLSQITNLIVRNISINCISKLTNLKLLTMRNTKISNIDNLINLEDLFLKSPCLLETVGILSKLTMLEIDKNSICDINHLTTLKKLIINNNNTIKHIDRLINLEYIFLNKVIGIKTINNFINLNLLSLYQCDCVVKYNTLSKLETVFLHKSDYNRIIVRYSNIKSICLINNPYNPIDSGKIYTMRIDKHPIYVDM